MQGEAISAGLTHQFHAIAFEENLSLRQLTGVFAGARIGAHELYLPVEPAGGIYVYPFGAMVTCDVPPERREAELARLRTAQPKLTTQIVREDYSVIEQAGTQIGIGDGGLKVDRLTSARAGVVALIVAQSAAMEYYERIVDQLFSRTGSLVEQLERRGSVPFRTRPLNRFIGEAILARNEVLSVLHLLDKPDATWEDAAMDRIYDDLRAEFDLADRYAAMESKLRSIQEALELVLDVARDRRLLLLEVAVVVLILAELVFTALRLVSLRRRIKQPTQNPTPTLAAIRTSSHNAGRPTATMAAASTLTIQVSNVKRPSVDTRHSDRLHSPSSTLRLFAL
jgi:required for meiotic nuclear division protein 1